MIDVLLIGVGGFLGSVSRYVVSGVAQRASHSFSWPWGTLAVNVLGCLLLGILSHLAVSRGALTTHTRALLIMGFLGGFTTFSSFSSETFNLLYERQVGAALANLAAEVGLGLAAVWLGHVIAQLIWR